MKKTIRIAVAALAFVGGHVSGIAQPIPIFGIVELSGSGTTAGTNYDNGVKLAVAEINAAGGILGRKINYTSWDTQTQPGVSKALASKAIDQGAPLVMGPVYSGSILVSMAETRRAEIPNMIGGEAAAITQQGNPYVFRASFTQASAMPKVVRYIKEIVKAKQLPSFMSTMILAKVAETWCSKALKPQISKLWQIFLLT